MFYFIIALLVIGLDQLTKWFIINNMDLGESITVIEDFLFITSHRNTGAAWGILEGQMWFFYIITVIVIIALIYYMKKATKGRSSFQIIISDDAWRSNWKFY